MRANLPDQLPLEWSPAVPEPRCQDIVLKEHKDDGLITRMKRNFQRPAQMVISGWAAIKDYFQEEVNEADKLPLAVPADVPSYRFMNLLRAPIHVTKRAWAMVKDFLQRKKDDQKALVVTSPDTGIFKHWMTYINHVTSVMSRWNPLSSLWFWRGREKEKVKEDEEKVDEEN